MHDFEIILKKIFDWKTGFFFSGNLFLQQRLYSGRKLKIQVEKINKNIKSKCTTRAPSQICWKKHDDLAAQSPT